MSARADRFAGERRRADAANRSDRSLHDRHGVQMAGPQPSAWPVSTRGAKGGRGAQIRPAHDARILALLDQSRGDIHVQYVWHFLRAQKIDLSGRKSWCESNDLHFVAKAAEIVGVYMATPAETDRRRRRGRQGAAGESRYRRDSNCASPRCLSSDALSLHSRRAHGEYSGRLRTIPSRLG